MKKYIWRTLACLLLIVGLSCSNDAKVTVNAASVPTTTISSVTNTTTGVKLSWTKATNVSGYYIYRKTESGSYSKIATVSSASTLTYTDKTAVSGKTYSYYVKAYKSSSLSTASNTKTVMYLKAITASDITVNNTDAKTTLLSWPKVAGATQYYVYRKTGAGSYSKISTTTSLSYTDKNVVSGTTYTYAIRAVNGSYIGDYTGKGNMYLDPITNLAAKNTDAKTVQLSWSKINGATGYYVYRMDSGKSYVKIATITNGSAVTYNDKNVVSGTTYRYAVRAINGSYIGNYFSVLNMYLDPITNLAAKNTDAKTVQLSWSKINGATGYYVYRMDPGKSYVRIATITNGATVAYNDKNVVSGTTYRYAVRAINGSYIGNYFSKLNMYLDPVVTADISMTNQDGSMKVSWKAIKGATGYRVYRMDPGKSYVLLTTTSGNSAVSYVDKNVSSGVTYRYAIRAINGSYIGNYFSKTYMYLATPEIIGQPDIYNGAEISWVAIPGATAYQVYEREGTSAWRLLETFDAKFFIDPYDRTRYLYTAFMPAGATRTYTVRALASGSISDWKKSGVSIHWEGCPHDYYLTDEVDGYNVKATCDKDGLNVFECIICGDQYTETVKATGHAWETKNITVTVPDSTTGSIGKYEYIKQYYMKCFDCGAEIHRSDYKSETDWRAAIEAHVAYTNKGHNNYAIYNGTYDVKNLVYSAYPTKQKTIQVTVCSKCGAEKEHVFANISHDTWITDDLFGDIAYSQKTKIGSNYYHICNKCGYTCYEGDFASKSDWNTDIGNHILSCGSSFSTYGNDIYEYTGIMYEGHFETTVDGQKCLACGFEK